MNNNLIFESTCYENRYASTSLHVGNEVLRRLPKTS